MDGAVVKFVQRRGGGSSPVRLRPLAGGLESGVVAAELRAVPPGCVLPRRFVVKQLRGWNRRELDMYSLVEQFVAQAPVARVLGTERHERSEYLFLEEIRSAPWPWRETRLAVRVIEELARIHSATGLASPPVAWDYEAELHASAMDTLRAARGTCVNGRRLWPRVGDLRRVVAAIPAIRAHLHAGERCLIHGDVHPGNALVRSADGATDIVFIDWARARIGSPFEDVACWLQSLGCWEPEARRRHDTLLTAYLRARGIGGHASRAVRQTYWLAAASNALSGAIRYHLAVLADTRSDDRACSHSLTALRGAGRTMRRAAGTVRELGLATAAG